MSRVRTSTTGAFTQVRRQQWHRFAYNLPYAINYDQTAMVGVVTTKTIVDEVTPGFGRIVNCGGFLPLNPCVITTTTEIRTPATVSLVGERFTNPPNTWWQSQYQDSVNNKEWVLRSWEVAVPSTFDESIVNYVTNAAVADAKSACWDVLTELGEGRETVNFVRDKLRILRSLSLRLARRARSQVKRKKHESKESLARRTVHRFDRLWLEYRYAISPLVMSVGDAVAALSNQSVAGSIVRGRARQVVDLGETKTLYPDRDPAIWSTEVFKITGTRTYRGRAFAVVTNPTLAKFGFDPVVTAWELTRFSFVIDWFLDVNSFLQAWSPFTGATLLGVSVSVKDSYTRDQQCFNTWGKTDNPTAKYTGESNFSTQELVEKYTRFASSPGGPALVTRLNVKRLVDLAALILEMRSSTLKILHRR